MGSPTELALEYRAPSRVSASCTSANFSLTEDLPHEVHRLEDRLNALEEERRKIEAFRRELPLCMQLLHDAIEAYKEQLTFCKPSTQKESVMQRNSSFNDTDSNLHSPSDRIVMEEFIPLQRQCEGELPCKTIQKPNWMEEFVGREVRANSFSQERCLPDLTFERGIVPGILEQAFSTSSKPYFHSKHKSGGAFTPFSRDKQMDKQVVQPTPRLGTLHPTDLMLTNRDQENGGIHHVTNVVGAIPKLGKGKPKENGQPHPKEVVTKIVIQGTNGSNDSPLARKARRCWSPELHRCFVNALQQLGGSEVATPKQIRELMKVEGLTNDEVKSHLQKYRLHTRRPNPAQAGATQGPPHVLVLGGIWVPPDYTAHAAAQQASSSVYSQQQSHLCQPTSSQELYSELGQAHHNQHATALPNIAPAHSQCSTQGNPLQLMSDMAVLYHNSSLDDNTREESVGDDGRSGNSSCKGSQAMLGLGNAEEMEDDNRSQDGSITGDQSHCISEDGDSRIGLNSRISETDLKMMMSMGGAGKTLREKK